MLLVGYDIVKKHVFVMTIS